MPGLKANALNIPPGDYNQQLKLKGIGGNFYKRWNMWFNPIIREEPYQLLYRGSKSIVFLEKTRICTLQKKGCLGRILRDFYCIQPRKSFLGKNVNLSGLFSYASTLGGEVKKLLPLQALHGCRQRVFYTQV